MLYFNDSLFDKIFDNGFTIFGDDMKSDLLESEGAYLLTIDIPGVLKENVSLDYDKDVLTVKVKKVAEDLKDAKYVQRERGLGDASRSYNIPDIDADKIKAKFENGVLEIVLPKKDKSESKKRITIE